MPRFAGYFAEKGGKKGRMALLSSVLVDKFSFCSPHARMDYLRLGGQLVMRKPTYHVKIHAECFTF